MSVPRFLDAGPWTQSVVSRRPTTCFLVLSLTLTWTWEVVAFGLLRLPSVPAQFVDGFVGPGLAAFAVTAVTDGRTGLRELLGRCVTWRVGAQWYLLALAGPAAVFILGTVAIPGALVSIHVPPPTFGVQYVGLYVVILLLGGPLGEEPGWRGFALPRLQQSNGPLTASIILGFFQGVWHLPLYLFIPGYNEAGAGVIASSLSFGEFVLATIPWAVVFTWMANHTRGSVLLTIMMHASDNTAGLWLTFFPDVRASVASQLYFAAFALMALLVIVVTRGRLSYERYLREVAR
jgi:membrane protease YdiL (CAAX protease family)